MKKKKQAEKRLDDGGRLVCVRCDGWFRQSFPRWEKEDGRLIKGKCDCCGATGVYGYIYKKI